MDLPKVTVISANFNKEPYIAQTIQSVLNQTYYNLELLVVDDNSTDHSIEIIEKFLEDKRLTLIKSDQNRGANHCRNLGLQLAHGKYVIFLDADDLLDGTCIEQRVNQAAKYPDGNLFVFGMELFNQSLKDDNRKWLPDTKNPLRDFLRHKLPWQTMQPLWERDFLLDLEGFDENFDRLQDVELHTRALLHARVKPYLFPSIVDCFYRIDEERRNFNMFEFLNRRAKSVSLYCDKFEKIVARTDRKYIFGTVIQTYWNLIYYLRLSRISREEYKQAEANLFGNELCRNRGFLKRILFSAYFFYNRWLPRVPGINHFLERAMINMGR